MKCSLQNGIGYYSGTHDLTSAVYSYIIVCLLEKFGHNFSWLYSNCFLSVHVDPAVWISFYFTYNVEHFFVYAYNKRLFSIQYWFKCETCY